MIGIGKFFAAAGVAAMIAFGGAAHAQTEIITGSKPLRLKIGGYFPTSGNTKNAFGKNLYAVGASYHLVRLLPFEAYADYADQSKSGGRLQIFDFGASVHFNLIPPALHIIGSPFVEAGLGYYSVKAGGGNTNNRLGGKVALGYELPFGVFGEAEYDVISKVNGYDPSGYRLNIGYRF